MRRSAGWGARLILQQALEDEVSDFLGRGRYERAGKREATGRQRGKLYVYDQYLKILNAGTEPF